VTGPFGTLLGILRGLDRARIAYHVTRYRYDAISVIAKVPGERWEIDVLEDGDVDFERFVSDGTVTGEAELNESIARWAEPAEEAAE
jgi:hypothetical protein